MRTHLMLSCVIVALFCVGAVAAEPAPHPHEPGAALKTTRYVVQVTSNADGAITNINLRGEGLPPKGLNFKADVRAYRDKLKELAAKHDGKTRPAAIDMEIELKLLQGYVVQLIDESIRAGFSDISPVPLDKSKR